MEQTSKTRGWQRSAIAISSCLLCSIHFTSYRVQRPHGAGSASFHFHLTIAKSIYSTLLCSCPMVLGLLRFTFTSTSLLPNRFTLLLTLQFSFLTFHSYAACGLKRHLYLPRRGFNKRTHLQQHPHWHLASPIGHYLTSSIAQFEYTSIVSVLPF